MASKTAKITRFNAANHRVIGGNRQLKNRNSGGNLPVRNIPGTSMHQGPSVYIPARTHPHLGKRPTRIQLATPSKIRPARGGTFNVQRFSSSRRARLTRRNGSQNASPPAVIQYSLPRIALRIRNTRPSANPSTPSPDSRTSAPPLPTAPSMHTASPRPATPCPRCPGAPTASHPRTRAGTTPP